MVFSFSYPYPAAAWQAGQGRSNYCEGGRGRGDRDHASSFLGWENRGGFEHILGKTLGIHKLLAWEENTLM